MFNPPSENELKKILSDYSVTFSKWLCAFSYIHVPFWIWKVKNGYKITRLVKAQCIGQIGKARMTLKMVMILKFWLTMSNFLGEFALKLRHTIFKIIEFVQIQLTLKRGTWVIEYLRSVLKRFWFMIRLRNPLLKEHGLMEFHPTPGNPLNLIRVIINLVNPL